MLAALFSLVLLVAGGVPAQASSGVTWAPAEEPGGFARALEPLHWRFPADFGPHPDYQTEWWYTTGNLADASGRPFGFQFTIFRQALAPGAADGSSPWRTPQVMSAHVTVSDITSGRFYAEERFSRASQGLAGASAEPLQVWLQDWRMDSPADAATDPRAPTHLQAAAGEIALDLEVQQSRPPVLQGRHGLSQKGPAAGNASHYYSLVQQPTSGRLRIGAQEFTVQGLSWTDHEIFTNSLAADTIGWDWFSAQFDQGRALMLYRLRQDPTAGSSPAPGGTAVSSDSPAGAAGTVAASAVGLGGGRWIDGDREIELTAADLQLEPLSSWRSPHSGATYPARWRLTVPRLNLALEVTPQLADQELRTTSATYWEGAVTYRGTLESEPLLGQGYAELTGYADAINRRLQGR